jgi:hypothetical protein
MVWLVLTGCGEKGNERVAVRFKGGSLTIEDLEAHRQMLEKQGTFKDNPERLTGEYVLDHAVNMEMIIAKGLKEELHLDPTIRAKIHGYMSDLFLKVMQDKLVPAIERDSFTEEEVKAYYDKNIENYRVKPLYRLKLIEHKDPGFLVSLKESIQSGKETFESAAKKHSSDESTKNKGGDTGSRGIDRYRPDWRVVIEPLTAGQISDPVKIGDHHYLFKVAEKTEPVQPSFEEKKAYVRNDLLFARYRDEWRKTYDKLKIEFDYEANEDVLHQFMGGECGHDHDHKGH